MRGALAVIGLAAAGCHYSTRYQDVDASVPIDGELGPDARVKPDVVFVEGVSVPLDEGKTRTFSAYLANAQPTHDITVGFHVDDPSRLAVLTPSLRFPVGSHDPLPVTIAARQDDDAVDDQVRITLVSPDIVSNHLLVAIHDDDVLTVVPGVASPFVITEGSSLTLQLHLAARPPTGVEISVTATGPDSVAPTALDFFPEQWNLPQVVTITSLHDANTISEDTDLVMRGPGFVDAHLVIHNVDTGP